MLSFPSLYPLSFAVTATVNVLKSHFRQIFFLRQILSSKENSKNISCTALLNLKVHVSNMLSCLKNEWGWSFKQHTVLLIMFRDMICVGELWLTKRSYAHQGLWDNELATILKKPLLAYSPISHARSK